MHDYSLSLLTSLSLSARTSLSFVPLRLLDRQHFRNAHGTIKDTKASHALLIYHATLQTDTLDVIRWCLVTIVVIKLLLIFPSYKIFKQLVYTDVQRLELRCCTSKNNNELIVGV